jgi:NitT/TauT family transport system substrate-binding protein
MGRWNNRVRTVAVGALLLGLVLMAVLIASCGGSDTSTTTSAGGSTATTGQAASTEFTILLPHPAPYMFYESLVAAGEGFFEKRGLKVKIEVVDGTEGEITGFAAGLGNILWGDLGSYLRSAATDQFHPIAFYLIEPIGMFDIMVPEDSPIKTAADLDGKVIGVTTAEDPGATMVTNMNSTLGINAKMLVVIEAMQAIAALNRGEIDAFAGGIADTAVMQAQGIAMRSVIPANIRTANGGNAYWSTRELMDADPAAFRGIVAGLQEARAFIGDDPQKLVDWVNAQEAIPAEDMPFHLAVATGVVATRPTDITPVGFIPPATWQSWWDSLVASKVIDPKIGAATDFYTNEFFQSQ